MNHTINIENVLPNTNLGRRRDYIAPHIELFVLDNEISLALESSPPVGPDEGNNLVPEFFNNDPSKLSLT